MLCLNCSTPMRNIGIGFRPMWHCDACGVDGSKNTASTHTTNTLDNDTITVYLYDSDIYLQEWKEAFHVGICPGYLGCFEFYTNSKKDLKYFTFYKKDVIGTRVDGHLTQIKSGAKLLDTDWKKDGV